jgi:serine O-acetyltransferase
MWRHLIADLNAVHENDPAATNRLETLLFHLPLHAVALYRLAHFCWTRLRLPLLPRMLSALAKFWSGVEIHPAATIGRAFFIDHGTGIVIGETAEIGDHCVMFHNVTLGGTGKHRGKRHPTIDDNVLLGTGATLLGPIHVGSNARVGANSFIRMHDVPANCTAAGTPARIVKRDDVRVDEELPRTQLSNRSIPMAASPGGSPARSAPD